MKQKNGCALEKVSDELKDDIDVVFEVVKNNGYSSRYAGKKFLINPTIIK